MNSKQFLFIGGAVLVLVGILGFVGVIGPMADKSIFGVTWWFDNAENWAHLVLGIVALIGGLIFPATLQKPVVILVGIAGVLIGLYSLAYSQSFLGANLENPADSILHLVVGAWALIAGFNKDKM